MPAVAAVVRPEQTLAVTFRRRHPSRNTHRNRFRPAPYDMVRVDVALWAVDSGSAAVAMVAVAAVLLVGLVAVVPEDITIG